MQLGFVSAIVPELSLDGVLAFAREQRFACVEAMCWPRGKAARKYAGITRVHQQARLSFGAKILRRQNARQ